MLIESRRSEPGCFRDFLGVAGGVERCVLELDGEVLDEVVLNDMMNKGSSRQTGGKAL